MAQALIAVLDANVLYPAPLRDFLIRLAEEGLIQAKWTGAIHDEWIRSLLRSKPALDASRLLRTRSLMDEAIRDCLVTGYEGIIESLALPDQDDRHVLAAAITAGADLIVTFNLSDFPKAYLDQFGVVALHPDELVSDLLRDTPQSVCRALARQRAALKKPPQSAAELLDALAKQGLTQSVSALRQFVALI